MLFLLCVVVDAVNVQSSGTATWPSIGGKSGYHRMNGQLPRPTTTEAKPSGMVGVVMPTWPEVLQPAAGEPTWPAKAEGEQVIARRERLEAELPAATARIEQALIATDDMFLDEAKSLAAQKFALSEEQLVVLAKQFLFFGQGVERPELLAPEFIFMGPFVGGAGGLPRADYLEAVGGFKLKDAFPDLAPRFHHFRADPLDAGRVWFTSQASGTDAGKGFLGNKPTGLRFDTPPQACSIKFNAEGLAVKYTIGHVMERSIGNTGGLGGVFGPAYAIGKPLPFPEANPWKPSKRYRALMLVGQLLTALKKKQDK